MTRRIATTAAMMAALLLVPASALAADSHHVTDGVLTFASGEGTVDTVTVSDGPAGTFLVRDTTTASGVVGPNCSVYWYVWAQCAGATSASLSTRDGDDAVTVAVALPSAIDPGAGADKVIAGDADDTIEARDGTADTIDCGGGTDTAHADPVDTLTNCELPAPPPVEPPVELPPPPPPPTPPPPPAVPEVPIAPPPLAVLPVTLEQETVKVSRAGVATLDLACAASEVEGCTGTVYLDPVPRAAKKKGAPRALAARRGRYGRGRFDVAAGKKARLRMSLSSAARRRLGLPRGRKARAARRGRRVKAQVTVVQRGKKPVKSRVTLKT